MTAPAPDPVEAALAAWHRVNVGENPATRRSNEQHVARFQQRILDGAR